MLSVINYIILTQISLARQRTNQGLCFVANAEGTTVVMTGMSTTDIFRENRDDGSIATDIIMIGGLAEASLASRNQVFDAKRAIAAGRATVYNEQFDCGMLKFFHNLRNIRTS